jgi:hypothetical protein
MVGIVSTVMVLLQVLVEGIRSIVLFVPLVFTSIFFPIYVGYFRGAIAGSMLERLRGWIYYCVGTATYFALIVVILPILLGRPADTSLVYLAILIVGALVARAMVKWLFSVTRPAFSMNELVSLWATPIAAGGLTIFVTGITYAAYVSLANFTVDMGLQFLEMLNILGLFCLIPFILIERVSREISNVDTRIVLHVLEDALRERGGLQKAFSCTVFCIFANVDKVILASFFLCATLEFMAVIIHSLTVSLILSESSLGFLSWVIVYSLLKSIGGIGIDSRELRLRV